MKKLLLSILLLPAIVFAHIPTTMVSQQSSLAPMLEKVTPAIVNIAVEKMVLTNLNDLIPTKDNDTKVPIKTYGVGSGVIFDAKKGLIVTNAHVVAGQKVMVVTLKSGERYHAKLIAKDDDYDIAIIQIHADHLTALPFSDSGKLKVGDFVTAIGSPYGLSQTVTSGMVSALHRSQPQIEGFQSFIQTDAPINPGNSGGALINMQGELVGINTAMVAHNDGNIGIGFAIPSDMAEGVVTQLLKYGKVERGVLGVIVQNTTPELVKALGLSSQTGALVSEIVPNTPAASSELQHKDVITSINGHTVQDAIQLRILVGLINPGTTANTTFIRKNQTKTVVLTVADPKNIHALAVPYLAGMRLQDLTELESNGEKIQGVLVTRVSDNSNGALSGLIPGDVITAVNDQPILSIDALKTALSHQTKPVVMTVMHKDGHVFMVL